MSARTYSNNLSCFESSTVDTTDGGITVVDYHSRGMNADFYPRYGPWLRQFLEEHSAPSTNFAQPCQVVQMYREYEAQIETRSLDRTAVESEPAIGMATGWV